MIFRQIFDPVSSTCTYLLARRPGAEALLIDPVLDRVDQYIGLIHALDLKLVMAMDTHIHADHVTAIGELRQRTDCATAMGEMAATECVSLQFGDSERLKVDGLSLEALYTPGHTSDSYCFRLPMKGEPDRLFTGDTLLIRGTGRTDFQNGDPGAQYDSLFGRLLKLPHETRVYPGHDYQGMTESTIGEELRENPRLQVRSREQYIAMMDSLELGNPKMMDVAVPANRVCGLPFAA